MKKNIFILLLVLFGFSLNVYGETTMESWAYQQSCKTPKPPKETGPGNGSGEGSGSDSSDSEDEAMLDSLSSETSALGSEEAGIAANGEGEPAAEAAGKQKSEEKKVSNAENASKETKSNNQSNSKSKKNSKQSDKDGDPVKVSEGKYEQEETDIEIGAAKQFLIKRRYENGAQIITSFGNSWYTNLDERIILGIDPGLENEIAVLKEYLKNMNQLINDYKAQLHRIYGADNPDGARASINSRITRCSGVMSSASSIISRASSCSGSRASSIISSASAISSSAWSKQCVLRSLYERIDPDFAELEQLKEEYRLGEEKLQYKLKLLELAKKRRARNKPAMFTGMDEMYEETGFETVTLIDENGYPHIFAEEEEDKEILKAEGDKEYIRCERQEDRFRLLESNGFVKEFDEAGFIVKLLDRNENSVNLNRKTDSNISFIETSSGEKFKIDYDGRKISKIENTRSSEEQASYSYQNDKLVSTIDTEGDQIIFDYDDAGRIVKIKKCDDSFISFVYGAQTADGNILITETINEEGFSEYFKYDKSQKRTEYIDHDGNKTLYLYDDEFRTREKHLPDGTVIKYQYDERGNLVCTEENGYQINFEYDERGNKISALYEDGSAESWRYDNYNQWIYHSDRDGVWEEALRDEKGNLLEFHRSGRSVYTQVFDSKGQVIRKTIYGQNPVTTNYTYDNYGNLISENCNGIKKQFEYDNRNRLKKESCNGITLCTYFYEPHSESRKLYNGLEVLYLTNGRKDLIARIQKDTVTGEIHKNRIEYDKRHLPLSVYAGDGNDEKKVASFSYTYEGKLKSQVLHGDESWKREFIYKNGKISEEKQYKLSAPADESYVKYEHRIQHGNNKVMVRTNGLGVKELFEYDAMGNLVRATDGNNTAIAFDYTRAGRLSDRQNSYGGWYSFGYDQDGFLSKSGEENSSYSFTSYYPDGNLKEQTDPCGYVTRYNYDSCGRLSSLQKSEKKIWYEYDFLNRLAKMIICQSPDESSAVYFASYDYSPDGRKVTVLEGGKYKTVFELDAFGNVINQIDGNNNYKSYKYDCQNQLIEAADGYGNKTLYDYNALGKISHVILPEGNQTKLEYNAMGLLEKAVDACGTIYSAEYDKAGRIIKEKTRSDSEKQYEYDKGGRLTKIICNGERVESYSYKDSGRSRIVTDGKGADYLYNFDSFGRLTEERNRLGLEQKYFYDSEGLLSGKINFDGSSVSINHTGEKTINKVTYSDGSENHFFYNSTGNIIEAENEYGKSVYEYDKGGKLVSQTDMSTGEKISFDYDSAGNRSHLISSNRETVYLYGKNNEVKEIFDNKQRMRVKLTYNKNGQEILRKFGNGTEEATHYDRAGRISLKTQCAENGSLLWAEGYVYGAAGKRTATVDNHGLVTLYEYDKKGQLSAVYYPYSEELISKIKTEAEINGLPVNAEAGENRFLTSSEKADIIPLLEAMHTGLSYKLSNLQIFIKENYSYDKNGNRISKQTPFGTIIYNYDNENCLISSGSRGENYVNYSYDKMGNLLSEESSLKSVKYAYNSQNRLIYCEVTDRVGQSYAQTCYAYDAFGRRVIVQDKGQTALRTLYDGLTFETIKQSPVYSSGLFNDSAENGIRWEKNGRPTGERYRYLGDSSNADNNRYFYLDDGTYKTMNSRYRGERTQFSINGVLAAQSTSDTGVEYFSTDLLGSVRNVTDRSGTEKSSYTYDAFGSLVQSDFSPTADFGYLGKQFDPTSTLYNYGYRDYHPTTARFTTVDPIRDGNNWFAYCHSDPINFLDPDGLFYYNGNEQESITTVIKTTVVILRDHDGLGNEFNSARLIYKSDGINTTLVYADSVGANCKPEYNGTKGATLPDGTYYLSNKGTEYTPLYQQADGTTNSTTYKNVLSLRTNDSHIPESKRDSINKGDNLMHADESYDSESKTTTPYNSTKTPGSAGCPVSHTQVEHDKMMNALTKDVKNPESITVIIHSMKHVGGKE